MLKRWFAVRCHHAGRWGALLGVLAATPALAASPTKVTADWKGGVSGLPSDVSMYVYVPSKVATNPAVLVLVHYCGGSAPSVFGQASTVINTVDQGGAIVVLPDNNARCWDVQTTKGLTRDGGGDSHAIKQMVLYAIATYKANADRVYSTGDSSGGMMTQLLLALYPDIFKAGASFAGIPAGCRSGNETGNGYSSACAGGSIAHTAQEWGDIVRKADSGYSGHRPRVQLFHGDQDQYISYKVHAEAIKEWANVLGLDPTTPTSVSTVTLGSHQASRQTWKSSCGYVVLDAFMSAGGDHGPSDCLFNSYVAPFLGLDKTGALDPEIDQCGGGSGGVGAGGNTGAGGRTGGASGSRDGSAPDSRDAGSAGAGGNGTPSTGGAAGGMGGSSTAGGTTGGGGGDAGGSGGRSSVVGSGGSSASGGGHGGGTSTSAAGGSGGNPSSGSTSTRAEGGTLGQDGSASASGCGCVLSKATSKTITCTDIGLGLPLFFFARRCSRGRPDGSASRTRSTPPRNRLV